MAKGSDNDFPSVLLSEQASTPADPATGKQRLYFKTTDHKLYHVNGAGVELEVGRGASDWGDIGGSISSQADLQAALNAKLDDTQLDTDATMAANSDAKIASQKAAKTYADTKASATRMISTTAPLTGGGDLSANRTLGISNFTGDSGSGGTTGAVPAPAAGDAAAGKFLKSDGSWAAPATGSTSPLTTKGDLYGYSTANARIPVGSDGQVLTADSTQTAGLKWAVAGGGASPLTTKGDLYTRDTADTRLPVGTDGQVLVADSTQAKGIKWAGGMVKLAEVTVSSPVATITFSSIPATFSHLRIVGAARGSGAFAADGIYLQYNGDTGSNYSREFSAAAGVSGNPTVGQTLSDPRGNILAALSGANSLANAFASITIDIPCYRSTSMYKSGNGMSNVINAAGVSGITVFTNIGIWVNTAAISSIVLGIFGGSNFVVGTVFTLYGL